MGGRRQKPIPEALKARPEDHILWAGSGPHVTDPSWMGDSAEDLRRALTRFDDEGAELDAGTAGRVLARFFFWARLWPEFAPVLQTAYEVYIVREALRLAANCKAFYEIFRRAPALPACFGSARLHQGSPFRPSEHAAIQAYARLHRLGHRIQMQHRIEQSATAKLKSPKLSAAQRQLAERQLETARARLEAAIRAFRQTWESSPAAAAEYAERRWVSQTVRRVLDVTGLKASARRPAARPAAAMEAVAEAAAFAPQDAVELLGQGRQLLARLREMTGLTDIPDDELEGIQQLLDAGGEEEGGGS